jgi:signal transduction histidine kinase
MDTAPATPRPALAPLWARARRWSPTVVDGVLALVVGVVQVAGTALAGLGQPERRSLDALGVALLLSGAAGLVVRRRHPLVTFAVAFAATVIYLQLEFPFGPIWFSLILALGTTVMAGLRWAAIGEIALGYVTFIVIPALPGGEEGPGAASAVGLAAWLLVLLLGAEAIRARRERTAEQARSREEEARRRVTEERLRIARELHDVVAHNISLVNLQAGVALHLLEQQPDQARTALTAIKDASKEALVELRSVLGVLRQVDEVEDAAPRAPTPGLARLDDLVAQASVAGVEVRVVTEGEPRPLAAGVDLAAFRIVQEALTNVARHAGPTTAEVRLVHTPTDLLVEVCDDGRRTPARPSPTGAAATTAGDVATLGSGNGLVGMRERAEAVGGELHAGPRAGFGWRVRARLPHGEPAAGDARAGTAGAHPEGAS